MNLLSSPQSSRPCRECSGFTIAELLVVIAIASLLVALTVPSINSTVRSIRLNKAAADVVSELNFARQTAISRQIPVEVRFYILPDDDAPPSSSPTVCRGTQTFLYFTEGPIPLNQAVLFANPVRVSSAVTQSSLFDNTLTQEVQGITPVGEYGTNYRYRSIYFCPSGQPNCTGVYFTMLPGDNEDLAREHNFLTVQIDGITGKTRIHAR